MSFEIITPPTIIKLHEQVCEWREVVEFDWLLPNDPLPYETNCGHTYELVSSPAHAGMIYCPGCARRIQVLPYEEEYYATTH